MVDLVHLQQDALCDVVSDHLKVVLAYEMRHVVLAACEEVVQADDLSTQAQVTVSHFGGRMSNQQQGDMTITKGKAPALTALPEHAVFQGHSFCGRGLRTNTSRGT